jgi:hypothetical protein
MVYLLLLRNLTPQTRYTKVIGVEVWFVWSWVLLRYRNERFDVFWGDNAGIRGEFAPRWIC